LGNAHRQGEGGECNKKELTSTKTIGQWTLAPVVYYTAQVTDDTSSAFYGNAVNLNRYQKVALGGLVGYNFEAATLNVWAPKEVAQSASGGSSPFVPNVDTASATRGYSVFASVSYRLWAPDEPASPPKRPSYFK
jgi:hypothetical protein